jgi:hypothetical protein
MSMSPPLSHIAVRMIPVIALALAAGGCATQATLPDRFALGHDAAGGRCTANRSWGKDQLQSPFDVAYTLTCEGAAASRSNGSVTAMPAKKRVPLTTQSCGTASQVTINGLGPAEARRCYDNGLAASAVVVTVVRHGTSYRGIALTTATTPMVHALAALTNGHAPTADDTTIAAGIKIETLAQAPSTGAAATGVAAFDPSVALRDGIAQNRTGLYAEASRVLNDALSRLPATTPADVQVELLLEAGLADSNIRFTSAALEHFARAETLLAKLEGERAAFLERKRVIYGALDALNRRDWNSALATLSTQRADFPLQDLTVLADLNSAAQQDASSAVVGPSAAQLSQIVLDAQRSWASSIAEISKGGNGSVAASEASLDRAAVDVTALLNARINPASLLWLAAQIERQGGRIAFRRGLQLDGDARAQAYRQAVTLFSCALDTLQGRRPADMQACAIKLSPEVRSRMIIAAAEVSGPVIAETQIERASVLARTGAAREAVLLDYDGGIDVLLASGRAGTVPPSGLEEYLDLLASSSAQDPAASAERFFKAIQAVGEPAIARQMSELQSVVAATGDTGTKVRERQQLTREIQGLRYQIEDAAADPAKRADLEKDRADKERSLLAINDDLASNSKLRAIDDRPATVAEIQSSLQPGELYYKLAEVRTRTYGIAIDKNRATIFAVNIEAAALTRITRTVRRSIRDDSGRIPFYNVGASFALFQLITGPAQEQILAAKAIVVDPAGPLSELPASVLVTDRASVQSYAASRAKAPYDYSKVAFLGGRSTISIALSPRSFIDARALPSSKAANPFIGFGQHGMPATVSNSAEMIQVGLGCAISRTDLARYSEASEPISASKIAMAADAIGAPNAPRMIGAAFTDMAVEQRGDLADYQVLHFATHGIPETQVGCASIPPSLITTLGGEGSDGFLSFGEVAQLKLDANLVVLSACETSASASSASARRTGQEETGRSLDGLVRAFLAANARAVLATYWKISVEQQSDQLFGTFYSKGRSESIGDALRDAQHELMIQPRFSHPYYWGAFFVVGDSSKSMLSKPPATKVAAAN